MFYYNLYDNYLVHIRSFRINSIFELYVMDTTTGNVYYKIFLCKNHKYPNLEPESVDITNAITIASDLFTGNNISKIAYTIDILEDLIISGIKNIYQKNIITGKIDHSMIRDMDIYYGNENDIEMSFIHKDHLPLYFKLALVKQNEICMQMKTYYTLASAKHQNIIIKHLNNKINTLFKTLDSHSKTINDHNTILKKEKLKQDIALSNFMRYYYENIIPKTIQRRNSI